MKPKFKDIDRVKHILTKEIMLIVEPYLEKTGRPCACHSYKEFQGKYLLRRTDYSTVILPEKELEKIYKN